MKKLFVVSVIMALMLQAWSFFSPAHAQESAKEEKPTFYRLIPGIYVNGFPRFTITYPNDWVERLVDFRPAGLFMVGTRDIPRSAFGVYAGPVPLPLEKFVDNVVPFWRSVATDVTIVSDKPSQLRDGTPAREVELQMIKNGIPYYWLGVATKRGDLQINANVSSHKGKIGEDLRAIPYSLQYESGKDEPVKVPPDVREFLDKHCNAIVSHDVAKVMVNYSDRYLNSGEKKGAIEQFQRLTIGGVTSFQVSITELVPAGDKAYLAGFVVVNGFKLSLRETSIIKENAEWKWYGNQRDVSP